LPSIVSKTNKRAPVADFYDEYEDDFGEESDGVIEDKKNLFEDPLAAGAKKTVLADDIGDSSKNDVPSLP
jgi:hypothetical protein